MKKQCAASGCFSSASGFSNLCTRHRKVLTRHGHPDQSALTVHELGPYLRMVVSRQKANPSSPAWSLLEDRWKSTADYAKTVVNAYEGGQACNRYTVDACRQLVALWDAVPPSQVVQMALAIYLQADDRPHRFKSDRAFGFQMVRRIRGLSTINAGSWWDPKTRKSKRVYKDLPPKTVLVMKELLVAAFGAAGLQLAGFERQQHAESEQARQRLAVALGALK